MLVDMTGSPFSLGFYQQLSKRSCSRLGTHLLLVGWPDTQIYVKPSLMNAQVVSSIALYHSHHFLIVVPVIMVLHDGKAASMVLSAHTYCALYLSRLYQFQVVHLA